MKDIISELNSNSQDSIMLENFIDYKFQDMYDFFINKSNDEISLYKTQIESYISKNLKMLRQINYSNKINLKFIVVLIEACAKVALYMEFQNLYKLLVKNHYDFDKKLKAQSLYIVNIRKFSDYQNNYKTFLDTLHEAYIDERESQATLTSIYLDFYLRILKDFGEYNSESIIYLRSDCINYYGNKEYSFLDEDLVNKICNIDINDNRKVYAEIQNILAINNTKTNICNNQALLIEESNYSHQLYAIKEPNFDKIKQISFNSIRALGDPSELFTQLNRGEKIIDDERLLYKYIVSFSYKHKAKLYDAFETILSKLNHTTINIIDWGCGQALATILLLEYIKENELNIDIRNITLIEPSKLALSRGLLHVDVLKQKEYDVKTINKDIDCLEPSDIAFDDNNVVLHLFSNILDVESFKLDKTFLQKISNNIQTKNYFTCVSPNINDKRNGRLDLFYKYFDENFDTDIISSRDTDISSRDKKISRYEKVFEVNYTSDKDVETLREEIKAEIDEIKVYSDAIYSKLYGFKSIVSPIMDPERLINNIDTDPDYVIFKIRKTAEVITSKIYSEYKDDESRVSQNDKINYLQHNKKVLSRKAVSHLHTIRTIGNISVHEHIDNPSQMMKEDAYFLTTALVLLIEDLIENKRVTA